MERNMKITSLRYTPANQNYKNNQQASPAFKGKIELIALKTHKLSDKISSIFGYLVVSFAEKLRAKGIKNFRIYPDVNADSENLVHSFGFCRDYDIEGDAVVKEALKKHPDSDILIKFTEGYFSN